MYISGVLKRNSEKSGSEDCADWSCRIHNHPRIEWRSGRGGKKSPRGEIVDRLFDVEVGGWSKGKLRKEIDACLKLDPPSVDAIDLETALIRKLDRKSLTDHDRAMTHFWELCRRLGCGICERGKVKKGCPHFFNEPGLPSTCKLRCQFRPDESGYRRCADCGRLIFCNYYSNPILFNLRAFYPIWAGYPYTLRRLLVILSVFGECGGMRTPGKKGSSYQLTHLAKMAGLNDKRASEKIPKLIQMGVLRETEGSRLNSRSYRYVLGGSEAAWQTAKSELLRVGIRKLLKECSPKARGRSDFKEGSDYTLLGSRVSCSEVPRVILGKPPPESVTEMLTAFNECYDAIWRVFRRRCLAVVTEAPGGEQLFGDLLGILRGAKREEYSKGIRGEEEELKACMDTLTSKVLSKYSTLSWDELRELLDYSPSIPHGKGARSIFVSRVI